uniref:SRCR domain-containing protein n=1 Tax=Scophthalmus maximus TaxID=52904 RepID=A0A8D3DJG7_SCOMX
TLEVKHRCGQSRHTLDIKLDLSVRLNGTNRCSGRLEVKSDESWSSVCEGEFEQQVAEVVCRELDCGAPSVLQGALYGEVEAPVWSREFQCEGNESHLLECHRSTCSSGRALGLTCSDHDDVRLVGGASHCSGDLEMNHQREWRPVAVWGGWNQMLADKVCTHLDCGSVVSTNVTNDSPGRSEWMIHYNCVQSKSALRECVMLTDDDETNKGIRVICSGNPAHLHLKLHLVNIYAPRGLHVCLPRLRFLL